MDAAQATLETDCFPLARQIPDAYHFGGASRCEELSVRSERYVGDGSIMSALAEKLSAIRSVPKQEAAGLTTGTTIDSGHQRFAIGANPQAAHRLAEATNREARLAGAGVEYSNAIPKPAYGERLPVRAECHGLVASLDGID